MGDRSAKFDDDQIARMIARLQAGETLTAIDEDPDMPSMATIIRWEANQDELGASITRAREQGYTVRADKVVKRAQTTTDPALGRLDFDAERWYLGKMHPKKFGDATTLKHADADGEKIQPQMTDIVVRAAALLAQALARDEPE